MASSALAFWLLQGNYQARSDFLTTTDSKRATQLIDERLPAARHATEVVVVRAPGMTVDEPRFRRLVHSLRRDVLQLGRERVLSVTTFYQSDPDVGAYLVSHDRHATIVLVTLAGDVFDSASTVVPLLELTHAYDARRGIEVVTTGVGSWNREAAELSSSDLRRAEIIGIPAALVILVLVFGSLVAAAIPLLLAGVAMIVAAAATAALGSVFPLSVFALNIIISMGLAVGVDYSLFIVSRYREERGAGYAPVPAVGRTGATAHRAILFSGMTVVFSLLGMLIVPYSEFTSLGVGATTVVLVSVAVALSLLPAALGWLGDRVEALSVRRSHRRGAGLSDLPPGGARSATLSPSREAAGPAAGRGSWWARMAAVVMRRPAVSLLVGVAVLGAVATPTLWLTTGATGVSSLPDHLSAKRGFDLLASEFSAGWAAPVQVVVDGALLDPRTLGALGTLQTRLAEDGRFTPVGLQSAPSGTLAVVSLIQDEAPTSLDALQNVRELRDDLIPEAFRSSLAKVYVGGTTAGFVDGLWLISVFQPVVIALVLTLSFVLLLVAFRSLLVAVTCILMNLLSVGASYGALVLVFQAGLGVDLLGFRRTETVEAWVPLLMFCVLFGLSMDYQVFLLSRIRERYVQTGSTPEAVAFGVQSTAGIITGAAAIMVAVFIGLASGELVMFQQIGFGLAVAVFLDATLVRTVIAPATIVLVGDRYWWLPRWLRWLPHVSIGEVEPAPATTAE